MESDLRGDSGPKDQPLQHGETEGQDRFCLEMSEKALGRAGECYADIFSHLHEAMCILVQC